MYPILFQIGPLTVYSFGTLMAVAALVGGWIASSELKRYQYDPDVASTMVIAAAVGGLLGARIFYIFEDWERFIQAPLDLILSGAGFTWYGGLFGGALAVSWVGRKRGFLGSIRLTSVRPQWRSPTALAESDVTLQGMVIGERLRKFPGPFNTPTPSLAGSIP